MRTMEETRQVVIRGRKKANRNEEEEIEQSKVYEKTIRPEQFLELRVQAHYCNMIVIRLTSIWKLRKVIISRYIQEER